VVAGDFRVDLCEIRVSRVVGMQGDLRRAVTEALTPVLRGARTSDDVLGHVIDADDLDRIERVQAILGREGLTDLADDVGAMAVAVRKAVGKRLGAFLGL
jgi:hypothetical protein